MLRVVVWGLRFCGLMGFKFQVLGVEIEAKGVEG